MRLDSSISFSDFKLATMREMLASVSPALSAKAGRNEPPEHQRYRKTAERVSRRLLGPLTVPPVLFLLYVTMLRWKDLFVNQQIPVFVLVETRAAVLPATVRRLCYA